MKAADREKAMAKMERRLAPGIKPAAYAASEEKPISRKTGRGRTGNGKTQEKKTGKEAVRETLAARKKIYVRYKEEERHYTAWDCPSFNRWRKLPEQFIRQTKPAL